MNKTNNKLSIIIFIGFLFLLFLIFLLWKYELLFIKSETDSVYTETGLGTQPVLNPNVLISSCGSNICQGYNFELGWKWCNKCGSIYNQNSFNNNCNAGGSHNHSGSVNYKINTKYVDSCDTQADWKLCIKCACLVNIQFEGKCYDKNPHNTMGSNLYYVCTKKNHGQCGWKWCSKCSSLFYAPSGSVCWDKESHDYSESMDYQLNTYKDTPAWIRSPLIFSDFSCKNLGNYNLTLPECQTLCSKNNCNAVNFTPSDNSCSLRRCSVFAYPDWYVSGSYGYSNF